LDLVDRDAEEEQPDGNLNHDHGPAVSDITKPPVLHSS
jgi:hypothetical protein